MCVADQISTTALRQLGAQFGDLFVLRFQAALQALDDAALRNENVFTALMEAGKVCTLGQISARLYEVGGQYRRNM